MPQGDTGAGSSDASPASQDADEQSSSSPGSQARQDADEPAVDGATGLADRCWRRLAGAIRWVADTFRGHSGAGQLKKREK